MQAASLKTQLMEKVSELKHRLKRIYLGVLTNSPRELRYEGEFKDGRMHGKFTYYWTE